jgi:hypothetical protein
MPAFVDRQTKQAPHDILGILVRSHEGSDYDAHAK